MERLSDSEYVSKIMHEIDCAYRNFKRSGDYIREVFEKNERKLSGEECANLYHWYGIPAKHIVLIALSHGFEIDSDGFTNLLLEDYKILKNMRPCNGASTTGRTAE